MLCSYWVRNGIVLFQEDIYFLLLKQHNDFRDYIIDARVDATNLLV